MPKVNDGDFSLQRLLPLGSKVRIEGLEYEVVGIVRRSASKEQTSWTECLLVNPKSGYRWLTETQGHWNYFVPLHTRPEIAQSGYRKGSFASVYGRIYKLYSREMVKVQETVGKINRDLQPLDIMKIEDFLSPPGCPIEVLRRETDEHGDFWSLGKPIEAQIVKNAFPMLQPMSPSIGSGPYPIRSHKTSIPILKLMFAAVVLLLSVQTAYYFSRAQESIHMQDLQFSTNDKETIKKSDSFSIEHDQRNLHSLLKVKDPESWLHINVLLINDSTGGQIRWQQTIEHNGLKPSLSASDEPSVRTATTLLQKVAAGPYHLEIEALAGIDSTGSGPPLNFQLPFTLQLISDVPEWGYFGWALLLICGLAMMTAVARQRYRHRKWLKNDF